MCFVGLVLARRIRETAPDTEVFGIDNLMRLGSESNRRLWQLGIKVSMGISESTSDVQGVQAADWTLEERA
jgi:hypothetical protein